MAISIPGARSVSATLDTPGGDDHTGGATVAEAASCVVACPPHPQHGGHRGDARLVAVADRLTAQGIDCLRIDYGRWDEGYGEREDARNALRWAADRYEHVGLFGYSFGGAIAVLAAASVEHPVSVVSLLAAAPRLAPDLDAVQAVDAVGCPMQLIYGDRDDTVDATELAAAIRSASPDASVQAFGADHFFVGQQDRIADRVVEFCVPHL